MGTFVLMFSLFVAQDIGSLILLSFFSFNKGCRGTYLTSTFRNSSMFSILTRNINSALENVKKLTISICLCVYCSCIFCNSINVAAIILSLVFK